MSSRPFLDTNVLLYLLSGDATKADKAEALLAAGCIISVQVLNEFASVATRKFGMSLEDVSEVLAAIRRSARVESVSTETHDRGLEIAERYRIPIFDAMIIAAALLSSCSVLYSEDFQNGLRVDRALSVRNPFR